MQPAICGCCERNHSRKRKPPATAGSLPNNGSAMQSPDADLSLTRDQVPVFSPIANQLQRTVVLMVPCDPSLLAQDHLNALIDGLHVKEDARDHNTEHVPFRGRMVQHIDARLLEPTEGQLINNRTPYHQHGRRRLW